MSALCANTSTQTFSSFVDSSANVLLQTNPDFNRLLLEFIHILERRLIRPAVAWSPSACNVGGHRPGEIKSGVLRSNSSIVLRADALVHCPTETWTCNQRRLIAGSTIVSKSNVDLYSASHYKNKLSSNALRRDLAHPYIVAWRPLWPRTPQILNPAVIKFPNNVVKTPTSPLNLEWLLRGQHIILYNVGLHIYFVVRDMRNVNDVWNISLCQKFHCSRNSVMKPRSKAWRAASVVLDGGR